MKKSILAICIIALFLGSTIMQVGAKQEYDVNLNEKQTQSESGEFMVFIAAIASIDLDRVDDLEIKGFKIKNDETGAIYLGATITGIANNTKNYQNSVSVLLPFPGIFRTYRWYDGEPINIKCAYFRGLVCTDSVHFDTGYFVRAFI